MQTSGPGKPGRGAAVDPHHAYILGTSAATDEAEPVSVGNPMRIGTSFEPDSTAVLRLVPSPRLSPTEPMQRVTQICIGVEHGLMLTDSCTVFTWGDNRYGQLGRPVCLKEEGGQAHPVQALLDTEVVQIASGTYHCLALAANGHVWSWGRNKSGQLGCGDTRDHVSPVKVWTDIHLKIPLGSNEQQRITAIGAGECSSVAASANSDLWQWGDIAMPKSSQNQRPGGAQVKTPMRVADHRVKKPVDYDPPVVSISRTDCRVIDPTYCETALQQVQNLLVDRVASIRALRGQIQQEREKELEGDEAQPGADEHGQKPDGMMHARADRTVKAARHAVEHDKHDAADVSDTIATLEREIEEKTQDVDRYTATLENSDLHEKRIRTELQRIMQEEKKLNEKLDACSRKIYAAKKGTADHKKHEEELLHIKELLEAIQNVRMTFTSQRTEVDDEKHRTYNDREHKLRLLETLKMRLHTVRDLSRMQEALHPRTTSLVAFLQDSSREIEKHFANEKSLQSDVAVKEIDEDTRFLEGMRAKILERTDVSDPFEQERAQIVRELLLDLIDMHYKLNDLRLSEESFLREDVDLSCFLGDGLDANLMISDI